MAEDVSGSRIGVDGMYFVGALARRVDARTGEVVTSASRSVFLLLGLLKADFDSRLILFDGLAGDAVRSVGDCCSDEAVALGKIAFVAVGWLPAVSASSAALARRLRAGFFSSMKVNSVRLRLGLESLSAGRCLG